MIQKRYRLKENEVKKVLRYSKPFFSYGMVVNVTSNTLGYQRFAIIIGGKSVKNSVERNFFRRLFYTLVGPSLLSSPVGKDLVFVIKKQTKLDLKDLSSRENFTKDILFLLKKTLQ